MRLSQVPGATVSQSGFVEFHVSHKRHPEQSRNFQHNGNVLVVDFMRAAYSINRLKSVLTTTDKTVVIKDGKDTYTLVFK